MMSGERRFRVRKRGLDHNDEWKEEVPSEKERELDRNDERKEEVPSEKEGELDRNDE